MGRCLQCYFVLILILIFVCLFGSCFGVFFCFFGSRGNEGEEMKSVF